MTLPADGKTIDFFGFGIAAVDDLLEFAAFPEPGSKTPALSRQRQGGGLCTTALVAAARLGLRCHYAGMLGRNELSEFMRQCLRAEGITVSDEVRHPDAEPFSSIIIIDRSAGERTILSIPYGVVPPSPEDVREDVIRASRVMFVDHLGPLAVRRACELARRHGVATVADIERIDANLVQAGVLELIDHLILPLRLAREHTGQQSPEDVLATLTRVPRPCTVVTDGADGCWYVAAGDSTVYHQSAFPIEVVDTTGCGDVFHGAYAAGLVWGTTPAETIRFAAAAAALKAMRPGAQAGAPTRAAVEAFLRARGGEA